MLHSHGRHIASTTKYTTSRKPQSSRRPINLESHSHFQGRAPPPFRPADISASFVYFKSDGIFKSDSQSWPTARKVQTSVPYSLTGSAAVSKKTRGKRPVWLPLLGQNSRSFFEARGRRMKAEPPNAAAGLRSKSPVRSSIPGQRSPKTVRGVYVCTRRAATARHFSVAARSSSSSSSSFESRHSRHACSPFIFLSPSSRWTKNSQIFWNSFGAPRFLPQ